MLNAERNGFSCVVYNRTTAKTEEFLAGRGAGKRIIGSTSLEDFIAKLERPRRILMMVKAGQPIDDLIASLSPLLEEGDLLIDGGNSLYTDTERRVAELESKSFGYIGMGVSGGAKGALEGPSMMPGGTRSAYEAIEPLVRKMAAQVDDGPCVTYIGPGGAGHFVKTVHNGIEYGIEQVLAEAYDLLKRSAGFDGDAIADVFGQWNATEELASFLVEITEVCLRTKDPEGGADLVELIVDAAGQKGTGLWTVVSALEMGVPVPTVYAALNARVLSSQRVERIAAAPVLPAPPPIRSSWAAPPTPWRLCRMRLSWRPSPAMPRAWHCSRRRPSCMTIDSIWRPSARSGRGLHHPGPAAATHPERLHHQSRSAESAGGPLVRRAGEPAPARPAPGGGWRRPGWHPRALPEQHPRLHRQLPQPAPAPEPGAGHARLLRGPHL